MTTALIELPVESLTIGEDVRLDEDVDALAELANSIATLGVLQPLTVRSSGDGWEVIAGRRRLAAARIVGLASVPCIVRDVDDAQAFDVAIAENMHRRDLSWIEVALAYARMRDRGMKQRQIAATVGRHESHVSSVLKLLTLPSELQDRVHRREISYMTAIDLASRCVSTKPGGKSTKATLTGADAELATHWRRRHDRLIAGIRAILAARPVEAYRWHDLLEKVLKIDVQPLDGDRVAS